MITAIVQARLGSTRLPGKLLRPILGASLLEHVVRRVQAAKRVEQIVLACSTAPADDLLIPVAQSLGLPLYRGSEQDVLDRFYQAAKLHKASVVVRITPDDPFKDPQVIDQAVRLLIDSPTPLDYVSNTSCDGSVAPTFPEGLDIEVFTKDCLARMWVAAQKPSEREHVTPYLFAHQADFRTLSFTHDPNLSHLRWTIDYEKDFAFAEKIYARLYPSKPIFLMNDILNLLRREPDLSTLNAGIRRNEGYHRSLASEATRPA